jgi:hypothetical protein
MWEVICDHLSLFNTTECVWCMKKWIMQDEREDVMGRGICVRWERSFITYSFSQKGLRTPLSTKTSRNYNAEIQKLVGLDSLLHQGMQLASLAVEFWQANFLRRRAIAFLAAKFLQCCPALTPYRARVLQLAFVRHDWSRPIPLAAWSKPPLQTFRKNTVASPTASCSATGLRYSTRALLANGWPRRGGNFSTSDVKRVI